MATVSELPTIPKPKEHLMQKTAESVTEEAVPPPPSMNNEIINMEQMEIMLNAVKKAIDQKIYNGDEIKTIFPIYNKLSVIVESMKRKEQIQKLYADVLA
jgi:predicted sugar kinase